MRMGTRDSLSSSAATKSENARNLRTLTITGWALTLAGCVLWTAGYFITGSTPLLDWPAFSPSWISDYLPNWQSEVGMAAACLGQIPLIYAEWKTPRQ